MDGNCIIYGLQTGIETGIWAVRNFLTLLKNQFVKLVKRKNAGPKRKKDALKKEDWKLKEKLKNCA